MKVTVVKSEVDGLYDESTVMVHAVYSDHTDAIEHCHKLNIESWRRHGGSSDTSRHYWIEPYTVSAELERTILSSVMNELQTAVKK